VAAAASAAGDVTGKRNFSRSMPRRSINPLAMGLEHALRRLHTPSLQQISLGPIRIKLLRANQNHRGSPVVLGKKESFRLGLDQDFALLKGQCIYLIYSPI
jgi:hypothetical protein